MLIVAAQSVEHVEMARELGYRRIVLDTLNTMPGALYFAKDLTSL